jgi:hypothetical protein
MKKVFLYSLVVWFFCSLSCAFVKTPETANGSSPAGANLVLKIDSAAQRTVSGGEAEVVSMDLALISEDGSQLIGSERWEPSGTVDSYSYCLELNKKYRLEVTHHYYDAGNVLQSAADDPLIFSIKPGKVTILTVTPGGIAVVVVPQATISIDSFAIAPSSALVGSTVTLNASVSATAWASVTRVSADLSALGGNAAAPLIHGSGNDWSLSYAIPASAAATTYSILLTASDEVNGISKTRAAELAVTAPVAAGSLAFANSDMEAAMENSSFGLKPTGSAYESTTGHNGNPTRALHVSGVNSGNAFAFTSAATLNDQGAFTKISFWVKGAITGGTKTVSIQIGSVATASGQIFPCGDITADKTVNGAAAHSYSGTLNTGGAWAKVTLNLMGVSSPNVVPATVTAGNVFSLKVGGASGVACDFWIDDILYE